MSYAQVNAILELKRKVCTDENGKKFVVINQNDIDSLSLSLDALCKDDIMALRRAKVNALMAECSRLTVNSICLSCPIDSFSTDV